VAAKTRTAKKSPAKATKKPAKPAPKPAKASKPAKPASKAKPVAKAKPAAKAKPPAKPKPVAKAKPAAKPAGGAVKRIAGALVKLVKPAPKAAAKPAAGKPAPKPVAKPAAKPTAKPAAKPAPERKDAPKTATKTAGIAMTQTSTPRPAAAAAAATKPPAAVRDAGIKAKAVKPARLPVQNEPQLNPLPDRVDLPAGYKPKAGEEYMSSFQLEYFRQKLLNWRGELVEESKQTIDNLREEVRDVGDDAERATRETENSLELRTRDRYRKMISKIDKALKRIEDGAYGYCEETGEEIGIERLEARPIATLCLDAQERWEHRQKLMGD
jgi:DnaK suppressor protein